MSRNSSNWAWLVDWEISRCALALKFIYHMIGTNGQAQILFVGRMSFVALDNQIWGAMQYEISD